MTSETAESDRYRTHAYIPWLQVTIKSRGSSVWYLSLRHMKVYRVSTLSMYLQELHLEIIES